MQGHQRTRLARDPHRRLRRAHPAPADHRPRDRDKPIYNEDRSVAVLLNGEIYNYRELRRDLHQPAPATERHPDQAVRVAGREHVPALRPAGHDRRPAPPRVPIRQFIPGTGYTWRTASPLLYPTLALLIVYAVATGNAGTGFRYRTSVIGPAICLLVVLYVRRQEREHERGQAAPPELLSSTAGLARG